MKSKIIALSFVLISLITTDFYFTSNSTPVQTKSNSDQELLKENDAKFSLDEAYTIGNDNRPAPTSNPRNESLLKQ